MKENIYFSQHGQDFIVDNLIKEPKVIIEVGCVDGLVNSNSFFFEKNYDTSCYLFEPIQSIQNKCKKISLRVFLSVCNFK